jgi:hypothetical protein
MANVFVWVLIVELMNCFHHGDFWIEFWGTAVVPVPSSTYCTHGAVKYWEYAQQYLGGYCITLLCACTVVYVLYSWYCDVLGVQQYLGGYGITLRCVCTIIYVLYSLCCHVLGLRTTVPWRLRYSATLCVYRRRRHHLVSCPTPHWMFHSLFGTFAVSSSFPPTRALNCRSWMWGFDCFVICEQDCCVESLFHHREFLIELLRYCCFACIVVYVLYSWCCKVLGVCMTVPWRFPYNSSMYCTHVFCFWCFIVHDCIFWLSISLPPLLLLS